MLVLVPGYCRLYFDQRGIIIASPWTEENLGSKLAFYMLYLSHVSPSSCQWR